MVIAFKSKRVRPIVSFCIYIPNLGVDLLVTIKSSHFKTFLGIT